MRVVYPFGRPCDSHTAHALFAGRFFMAAAEDRRSVSINKWGGTFNSEVPAVTVSGSLLLISPGPVNYFVRLLLPAILTPPPTPSPSPQLSNNKCRSLPRWPEESLSGDLLPSAGALPSDMDA